MGSDAPSSWLTPGDGPGRLESRGWPRSTARFCIDFFCTGSTAGTSSRLGRVRVFWYAAASARKPNPHFGSAAVILYPVLIAD